MREALRLESACIGPEHFLLAVLVCDDGAVDSTLALAGTSSPLVAAQVRSLIETTSDPLTALHDDHRQDFRRAGNMSCSLPTSSELERLAGSVADPVAACPPVLMLGETVSETTCRPNLSRQGARHRTVDL